MLALRGAQHVQQSFWPIRLPRCLSQEMSNCRILLARTLGVCEVDDVVLHEQVHLLNAWDCVHTQSLERCLKPLVICGRHLVHGLLFPAIDAGREASFPLLMSGRGHDWGLEWAPDIT